MDSYTTKFIAENLQRIKNEKIQKAVEELMKMEELEPKKYHLDITTVETIDDVKSILAKYLGTHSTNNSAVANDNRIILWDMINSGKFKEIIQKGGGLSPVSMHNGTGGREVLTNNEKEMRRFLSSYNVNVNDLTFRAMPVKEQSMNEGIPLKRKDIPTGPSKGKLPMGRKDIPVGEPKGKLKMGKKYIDGVDEADEQQTNDPVKLKADVTKVMNKLDMSSIAPYLDKIDNPTEESEMIAQFAEKIGVPKQKLSSVIAQLKTVAENTNPKMTKNKLFETVTGKKVIKTIKVKDIK